LRIWLALAIGTVGSWLVYRLAPPVSVPLALAVVAAATLAAGFVAGRRGALIGFGSVVIASTAWAIEVMLRSWLSGDLARTFPDCDPCGFVGYGGRMAIVTGMTLAAAGPLGAAAGWLGARFAPQRR